jgi:Holliday junction resolvase RusA-like endonuclease
MFTTRHIVSFFVRGEPAPGGSKNAFVPTNKQTGEPFRGPGGRIIVNVVDAGGERTKEWRKRVAWEGKAHFRGSPVNLPLQVALTFYLRRPKAHFTLNGLRPDAPEFHMQTPDVIKLARSTEDALTGIAWLDDCTSIQVTPKKFWNTDNTLDGYEAQPGCLIEISEILSSREQSQELDLTTSCPAPSTPTPRPKTEAFPKEDLNDLPI